MTIRRRLTPVTLLVAGVLLVQAAWVLAVPPYGGSDEFDHAHRAAGVAMGQFRLTEPAQDGRGLLVWVPQANVQAAERQCASLKYTGRDNCYPVETADGRALIATAAGGYNPFYYTFMGTAGLLGGDGVGSLYAMRIATVLLALLCIGMGVWALRTWHSGPWALFGVVVGLSPTLLYSTAVAAPNGIEMAAALPVWLALLGLRGVPETARRDRQLMLIATLMAPVLIAPRTLGPVWFAAIGLTVLVWHGRRGTFRIVRALPRPFLLLMGVALVSAAANIAWVMVGGGYAGEAGTGSDPTIDAALEFDLWSAQMVGAFPFRNQATAMWIYPTVFLVIIALLVPALRAKAGMRRAALVVGLVLMYLVPALLILATLQDRGGEYQGRYALPFVVGILPMAGLLLDEVAFAPREGFGLQLVGLGMLGAAHTGAIIKVQLDELQHSVSRLDENWFRIPGWLLGAIVLLGWTCHALGLREATRNDQ